MTRTEMEEIAGKIAEFTKYSTKEELARALMLCGKGMSEAILNPKTGTIHKLEVLSLIGEIQMAYINRARKLNVI